jgi:predicted component of type VI protein secretion system
MPLELIIREGDGPDSRKLVAGAAAILGRREDNDVVLPFSFVSARHGRLFLRGGVLHFEDMGSTNGTLVNGTALEPLVPRPLAPDDVIEIDRLVLRARVVDESGASPPRPGGAPAGVFEMQAGGLPPAPVAVLPAPPLPPSVPLPPEPFLPSRTLARVAPRVAPARAARLKAWSVILQAVGLLAAVCGLALLLTVLFA